MSIFIAIYCFFLAYWFRDKSKPDWQSTAIGCAVLGVLWAWIAGWFTTQGNHIVIAGGIGWMVYDRLRKQGYKFFGLGVLTGISLILWYWITAFLVYFFNLGWFLGGLVDIIYVIGLPIVGYGVYFAKCANPQEWIFDRKYLEAWDLAILTMLPVWIVGDFLIGRVYV